jgi:ribosomal protein S18 acetylase RimI-like enzyme
LARLFPAAQEELPAVAELVNSAYRGDSSRQGWTTEADVLGGQRTDPETLAAELATISGARLLTLREAPGAPLLGCVWLQPTVETKAWHLGMLTVRPDLQDRGLGRRLLTDAESAAAALGADRIRMTVIHVRAELIAWYERRGYRRTGETRPFPYGDLRFGEPRREDLEFIVLEKPLA